MEKENQEQSLNQIMEKWKNNKYFLNNCSSFDENYLNIAGEEKLFRNIDYKTIDIKDENMIQTVIYTLINLYLIIGQKFYPEYEFRVNPKFYDIKYYKINVHNIKKIFHKFEFINRSLIDIFNYLSYNKSMDLFIMTSRNYKDYMVPEDFYERSKIYAYLALTYVINLLDLDCHRDSKDFRLKNYFCPVYNEIWNIIVNKLNSRLKKVDRQIIEQRISFLRKKEPKLHSFNCIQSLRESFFDIDVCEPRNLIFYNILEMYNELVFEGKLKFYKIIVYLNRYDSITLRECLSDVMSELSVFLKENQLTLLIGIETEFSYRDDIPNFKEIDKELKEWIEGDIKEDNEQVSIFKDNLLKAMNFECPNSGYKFRKKYNSFIFDDSNRFNADGSAAGIKMNFLKYNKKKKKFVIEKDSVSKTFYYQSMDYKKYQMLLENVKLETKFQTKLNYSQAIIKSETNKLRVIINADINSYPVLTKITDFITQAFKNKFGIYPLMNNKQKIKLNMLFNSYLYYNQTIKKRYLCMPLDYSKFDHTISKKLIIEGLKYIVNYIPLNDRSEYLDLIISFEQYLQNHKIEFKTPEKSFFYKYKNGMLSGWKFTNTLESILNYVFSYGIILKFIDLNPHFKLELLVTMGDDIVIILDNFLLKKMDSIILNRYLFQISELYREIGFIVNPSKNSISFNFIEFLRQSYMPYCCIGYNFRSILNLFYVKPVSEQSFLDISNIYTLSNLITKRCFQSRNEDKFLKKFEVIHKGKKLLKDCSKFIYHRLEYKIKRKIYVQKQLILNEKELHNSYVYWYIRKFIPFKINIDPYIKDFFSTKFTLSYLEKDDRVNFNLYNELNISKFMNLINFKKIEELKGITEFSSGNYLLDTIIIQEFLKKKLSTNEVEQIILNSILKNEILNIKNRDYNFVLKILKLIEFYKMPRRIFQLCFSNNKYPMYMNYTNAIMMSLYRKNLIFIMLDYYVNYFSFSPDQRLYNFINNMKSNGIVQISLNILTINSIYYTYHGYLSNEFFAQIIF